MCVQYVWFLKLLIPLCVPVSDHYMYRIRIWVVHALHGVTTMYLKAYTACVFVLQHKGGQSVRAGDQTSRTNP